MQPNLVGAIDGENVSFALVKEGDARLQAVREYKTDQFPTFTDALQSYTRENQLSTAGLPIGLAVAGVTRGDKIEIRPMAYVTLTIDHRVIDAFQTNAWLSRFVEILETWPA